MSKRAPLTFTSENVAAKQAPLENAEIKTTLRYAHTSREAKRTALTKLSVKMVTNGPAKQKGLV